MYRRDHTKTLVLCTGSKCYTSDSIGTHSPLSIILAAMAVGVPTVLAMAEKPLGSPYIVKSMCLTSCCVCEGGRERENLCGRYHEYDCA